METAAVSGRDEERELPAVVPVPMARTEASWAAFGNLYGAEQPRLVRVAFLLTGSFETAQDVVQDSFVRVYRRWDQTRDPARYLYRTVANGCRIANVPRSCCASTTTCPKPTRRPCWVAVREPWDRWYIAVSHN
jgi:hypothetical protein